MIRVGILTASDKGARGEREDLSGQAIRQMVAAIQGEVCAYEVVPDEKEVIRARLLAYCDELDLELVLTTGGTGFAPRDVTPEATLEVVERPAPGITEAMRAESLKIAPQAMLSRAVAGIRGGTLIINLPGSAKAVRECLAAILPILPHGLDILRGRVQEHGAASTNP